MKRYLFFALLSLSALTSYAYDVCIDGIYYNLVPKGKVAQVTNNGNGGCYSGDIVIPAKITSEGIEYSVTTINYATFSSCSSLTSVQIPNTITSIESSTFAYCRSLSSIQIPNSVKSIGAYAFTDCRSITSIEIPNSVTSIGACAFEGCSSLASVELPNSITTIEWGVFKDCTSLASVKLQNSMENIGERAFMNCTFLASIQLPNSVLSIGNAAFLDCSSLTSIQIPNSVTSIGNSAFSGCSLLASIQIPNSVTSLGDCAFSRCSSLTAIQIPNSITNIGEETFNSCSSLTSIQIPNSVTNIGDRAFVCCSSLSSIQLPNSLQRIGKWAFASCNSLTSIKTPNLVQVVDDYAFKDCENLTNVTLGSCIENIGVLSFANCPNLENVYCYSENVPSVSSNAFAGSYIEYANLYVPAESLNAYKTANVWKDFGNICSLSGITFAETINASAAKNVLSVGETETLTANVLPANTTNKSVTWASSDSNIVSVNAETGEITAVAYGSAEITATAMDGSNVKGSVTITVKAENYALTDGEEYLNDQEVPCDELTYTRSFTNTTWNALYVPFSMQYEDWSADFEVARLNDVHQFDDDEDGVVDRTVLELIKLKEGSSTEPNTPYMIKAKEEGEKTITLTDATLYATEENSFDVTSWFTRFTFTGTYSTITDMATKGHYALADGSLMQASSDAATLGAFRWYLDITDRNGNPASSKAKRIFLSFDDGETTEINVVETNVNDTNANSIYSVSGVNVGKNKAALPKGLYISNGKKFLIK